MARVRVFKSYLKTPFLVLLALEVCIIFFSVYSAAYLRFIDIPHEFFRIAEDIWSRAAILAVITPTAMLATGLYQGHIREGMSGIFLRLVISLLASGIFVTMLFYLIPGLYIGRSIMAIALVQSLFVIGTLRAIFLELVDTEAFKKNVLVYGAGKTAAHIDAKLRRKSDRRSFTIVGYVLLDHQKQEQAVQDSKLIALPNGLLDYVKSHEIDEIVVATSDIKAQIPVEDLVQCKLNGIEVLDILSFFEREVGQIRIDIIDPRWLVFSEGFQRSQMQDSLKRIFDLTASTILAIIALPFVILAVIAIKIEDGLKAPVLYHQTRAGLNGKPYRVYKFRSMIINAESAGKAVWASKTDSRITRVGAFIRKTRIDELPQIFNVLNGTMSFVGPRPERPEIIDELAKEIPYYNDRHRVKPGITGWAQLMYPYGSSLNDSYQKQLYDMYYVKNYSLFFDFLVLLQTVEVVLFGKGAR